MAEFVYQLIRARKAVHDKVILDDVTVGVFPGAKIGVVGPNGAGKSTLLNMLAGVLAPSSGVIELDGVNVATDPLAAKRNLCYVSDSPDHLLRLKGHEFLRFIADVYEVPDAVRGPRIASLAREYGMEGELDNQIQSYSHGMRQKMMIMGALLPDPAVWILDEPMTGLDPRRRGCSSSPCGATLTRARPCSSPPTCSTWPRRSWTAWA